MFEHLRSECSPKTCANNVVHFLQNEAGLFLSNLSRSNKNKTMKKRIQFIAPIGTIMKVSFIQIVLAIIAATYTYGHVANAQELLMQKVSVSVEQKEIRSVLTQLEAKANVKFVYSSRSLPVSRKVSLSVANKTVSEVLDELFLPDRITYKIVKERIVLTMAANASVIPDQQEKKNVEVIDRTIRGKVTDEKKEALPGVNIAIKGTTRGAITDVDGNFAIDAPDEPVVLVFSFVGYIPQEISPGNSTQLSVSLQVDTKALNEVIVVGYGERKKETLTGAITQIGEEVFKDRAVSNAALSLQGEVPGLTITRTSSRPGNEGLSIRLRGESSITGVDPLIIIDGIPVIGTWELNQINPNDIESMSVLKDASAAIYGARAAGGVILVTTKRGKGEKMQITYNANVRLNTIGIRVPYANMQTWAQMYQEASVQDRVDAAGNPVEWFPQWGKENIERMANGESFEFTNPTTRIVSKYESNNWFDALYGRAVSQQHNVGLRGSNAKSSYMFSLGFANNKSVLRPAYDGEKKYNARFNYDYQIAKNIKLETGLSYDRRMVENPKNGIGNGFFDAPVFPIYNSQGQYYDDYGQRNPYAMVKEGGRVNNAEGIFRLNTRLSAEILKGLKISGTAGIVQRNGWKSSYNRTYQLFNWLGTQVNSTQYPDPEIVENIAITLYQNYGAFVDYNKVIGNDHNFGLMVGTTAELNELKEVEAKRTKLEFDGLTDLNTASNNIQTNKGGASHWGLVSYVGRFNYSYKEKYLIEALGRRDGSSKFHPDYRWSNFYGVSAGWRLSEESFIKNLGVFTNLKVRASYGETGGQANIGNYDYVSGINTTGTMLFGQTAALQQTAYLSGMTSLTRTWERIINKNVGLDFGILNNKITGSFDLFQKRNVGMLIDITYPQILGATAPKSNSGELKVDGWEFAVNWRDKAGEFRYNIGFQLSDNHNKLVSMEGKETWTAGTVAQRQGYALNSIFVYKTDGYFKDQEEVNAYQATYTSVKAGNLSAHAAADKKLRPGDVKVVDLDGNGYIDPVGDGTPGSGDVYYYGDRSPHYTFGVNLSADWKGFDFSAFFQGVGKQYLLREGNARGPFFRNYLNVNSSYIGNTWTPENTDAEYPRLSFDNDRNNWNWRFNDVNVQKLTYVRLKSLVVGYTLPKAFSNKIKTERIRFYFSGNDLFEFTSVKDGFDPEQGPGDSTYPFIRTWSLGLDLTF
ncbi:hypothetical protein DSL64_13605 [Dyadobacter luteus]|uniref:TonB-dependent receptor plug domain-containing protein n=2 Tax=Dyadobacter luteus TaxID=2259619 RepID=A0A3D8YE55_9BACT|nr:hypothetical protein DSL64_13605 [Dyadobacter luteus]